MASIKNYFKKSYLKSDAPEIYEKDATFYQEAAAGESKSKKKEKEMTLKDFDRQVAQKKGGVIDEEQEEMKVLDNQGEIYDCEDSFFQTPYCPF